MAVAIILSDCNTGKTSFSYANAIDILNIEPLEVRREKLCLTFARKTLISRHKDMFPGQHEQLTREKTRFHEHNTKHGRYFDSPLNYLTRMLNI